MGTTINTSRAQSVTVDVFNYDTIPLAATYTSGGAPIDLTQYKFDFILSFNGATQTTYTIAAGELTSAYLSKTGVGVNVLDMEKMFEHIRDNATHSRYKLLQVVTDPAQSQYVYIIYTINAKRY
jgi:hypothetical protein